MPLASTSSEVLRIIQEATFGVTPVTGNPSVLRITGETLKFNLSKESSKEINKSRTVNSVIPVDANANGSLNTEVFAGNLMDMLLAAVMQSAWVDYGTVGLGVSTPGASATGAFTATAATAGTSLFTLLKKGQWVRLVTNGPNNGKIVRLHSSTAPTPTVLSVDPATPLIASASESIQVNSSRLTHGTTQNSFTIERENSDVGVFTAYTGMTFSKMSLDISAGALSSMTFDLMGKSGSIGTATILPGTPIASPTSDIHSGVSGASSAVMMDGAVLANTFVKKLTLSFDNALRAQNGIGTLGAVGIGSGTIAATITASVYFADKTLFDKYKGNTSVNFQFATTDMAGNGYVFTAPTANITDYTSNASAKDNDQMLDIVMTLLSDDNNADSASRKLLFIDQIGVAV